MVRSVRRRTAVCHPLVWQTGEGVATLAEHKSLDGGNQLRVSAGKIFGVKKNVFNSADYATITISSWVA